MTVDYAPLPGIFDNSGAAASAQAASQQRFKYHNGTVTASGGYSMSSWDSAHYDASAGSINQALPASGAASIGDEVELYLDAVSGTNTLIGTFNGSTVMTLKVAGHMSTLRYNGTTWLEGPDRKSLASQDGRYVQHDAIVWNVLDHGVKGDGTTDDTDAINALALSVSGAGGGTLHFPRRTYVISRGTPNTQASGINVYSNMEYHFDNATLLLAGNCNFLRAASTLGSGVQLTANTSATDTTLTVGSSASFTVGQQVFLELGQAAYDTGEPDHWLWAKVLAIPDSTHVQIDRPVGYAVNVTTVTSTAHKTIYPFTAIVENWAVTGQVDLINPMTGSANAENGFSVAMTRNARIEKISGIDPGAGLISMQYAENIVVGNVTVRRSTRQNGASSKGNGINFSECRNVVVSSVHATDCEGYFVSAESRVEEVTIHTLHVDNGFPARSTSRGLFVTGGLARVRIEALFVNGVSTGLLDNVGGGDGQTVYIGDATFKTDTDPNISSLAIIEKSLRLRDAVYNERRVYATTILLTPSMSGVVTALPSGLVRRMRIYASSTTGITSVTPRSVTANGNNVVSALVTGQLVNLSAGAPLSIGTSGGGTGVNRDDSQKQIVVSTDGTVPAGAYLVVEMDYYRPTNQADDLSQGRFDASGYIKPASGIPESDLSVALQTAINSATAPNVQTFTASGNSTWTAPIGISVVQVLLLGCGGGGGSGAREPSGTVACGGGGGAGGALSRITLPASVVGASQTVSLGQAGTGGAAVTADGTVGNAGASGGVSTFGSFLRVGSAAGGNGGTTTAGAGGNQGAGSFPGANGGSASTSGGSGGTGSTNTGGGAAGGGAGGGISSGAASSAGGSGGVANAGTGSGGGSSGAINTGGGAASNMTTGSGVPGPAGGGGGGSTTGAGGTGGAGGLYGGGGGGGGASLNGNNSGAGGAGGAAICIVISQ